MKKLNFALTLVACLHLSFFFLASCQVESTQPPKKSTDAKTLVRGGAITAVDLNAQPVFGLGLSAGVKSIFKVDYYTGAIVSQVLIKPPAGSGFSTPNSVFGIARRTTAQGLGANHAILSASSDCGLGTKFYNIDLNNGILHELGSAYNYTYIRDIEFQPGTNMLYGIYDNKLIRIDPGTDCNTTNPVNAKITIIGTLDNVGVGPYSVCFNKTGDCYIISARDHKKAIVSTPSSPQQIPPLPVTILAASTYQNPGSAMSSSTILNNIEVATCISGGKLIIAVADPSIPIAAFYHFGTPWSLKGSNCLFDYTSIPQPVGPK